MDKVEPLLPSVDSEAYSYREMHNFASAVAEARQSPATHRRAARRVVNLLRPVIEQPIAPAGLLSEARKQFVVLVKVIDTEHPVAREAEQGRAAGAQTC